MRASYSVDNFDEIELSMTISMSAKEWCDLRDQLVTKWPDSPLSMPITTMLNDALKYGWEDCKPSIAGEVVAEEKGE